VITIKANGDFIFSCSRTCIFIFVYYAVDRPQQLQIAKNSVKQLSNNKLIEYNMS